MARAAMLSKAPNAFPTHATPRVRYGIEEASQETSQLSESRRITMLRPTAEGAFAVAGSFVVAILFGVGFGGGLGFGPSSASALGGDGRTAARAHAVTPLAVGERVPSVTVEDVDGNPVELGAVIGTEHAVFIFYRGGWCPYCDRQLSKLRKIDPELRNLGFRLVAISADRPEKLVDSRKKHDLSYTLLSDHEMNASRAFGIAFQVDRPSAAENGTKLSDLEEASGETHHLLPVPSVFLIESSGVIRFVHSDPDYRERLPNDALLEAARKVAAESKGRNE